MEWVERSVRFNDLTLTVRARYRRLPFSANRAIAPKLKSSSCEMAQSDLSCGLRHFAIPKHH
jgi:hypothetical protein